MYSMELEASTRLERGEDVGSTRRSADEGGVGEVIREMQMEDGKECWRCGDGIRMEKWREENDGKREKKKRRNLGRKMGIGFLYVNRDATG
jgi:hypothetical protein